MCLPNAGIGESEECEIISVVVVVVDVVPVVSEVINAGVE
jgi:hypothetical protein